jgi:hypothetical protein
MDEMPIVQVAIVRRVLAHRGNPDAVLQDDIFQSELVKQFGHVRSADSSKVRFIGGLKT